MTHSIGVFVSLFDDEGRILLVRQGYNGQFWAQPGGRLEPNEAPIAGVLRELAEETGYAAEVTGFIGTYPAPYRDDIVLHFHARPTGRGPWTPDGEITACAFFAERDLPPELRTTTRARIADAFAARSNVFRTHHSADDYSDL
jgi:ADP-ribose pyrophosphatase YjhB (NUDIX family)